MYNIAIVEDEDTFVEQIEEYLEKYSKEKKFEYHTTRFKNGAEFVLEYKPIFDIVFMDVDMPKMNGFEASKKLREIDKDVTLIFITLLAKYAIRGYEFNAFDYILKPVVYGSLKIKLDKIIAEREKSSKKFITIPVNSGLLRIDVHSLNYVEIDVHKIIYHTSEGDYEAYGTMKSVEKILPSDLFCKCSRSYLVNLRSVSKIENDYIVVGKDKLWVGRTRKKEFLDALQNYELSGN